MSNKNHRTDLLHLAESTALLAGEQLKSHPKEWHKILKEEAHDVKITADKAAEALILTQLKAATTFPILTEETGWHEGKDERFIWIVDPLDGTFNYLQNIPFCCVAIALVENQQPRIGVIYDFNRDELFSGIIGEGAWLNNQPLHVSKTTKSQNAVLVTGFPSDTDYSNAALEVFYRRAQNWKKIRMLGSAALSLAYVAAGRADAYEERNTNFWDVAAGCALVKAAGGAFKLEGEVLTSRIHAIANNGKLNIA